MDNTKLHTALCHSIESYVLDQGGYIVKNIGGLGIRRGRWDFNACVKGRAIAIEAKTGTGELSADQQREKRRMEPSGMLCIEARSVEEVEDALLAENLVKPSLFRW